MALFFCVRAICKMQPSPQRRDRPRRAGAASPRLRAPPPRHGPAPLRPLACPAPSTEQTEARRVTSASISAILANVPLMAAAAAGPGAARESPQRHRSSGPRRQRAGAPRLLALRDGKSREKTVGGKERVPAALRRLRAMGRPLAAPLRRPRERQRRRPELCEGGARYPGSVTDPVGRALAGLVKCRTVWWFVFNGLVKR